MRERLFAAGALAMATGACGSGPTAPVVLGYTVAIKAPPTSASAGSPVPIVFTATENESDGTSRPASGQSFTVTVTAGGGTVNGAASATFTTAADGTDSLVWVLGTTVGTQSLRGSLSSAQYADVHIAAEPLPTLLVTNASCNGGQCDSIIVLAFPDNQPHTPAGLWSVQLGIVTGPQACFTLPPSATFTIYSPGYTPPVVFTWTPAISLSLGSITALNTRLFANPSTAEFMPVSGGGWHVTLPGSQVVPDAPCTP